MVFETDVPLGGITFGADRALYVGAGVGVGVPAPVPPSRGAPYLVPAGGAEILRFPRPARPGHSVFVDGLDSVNGLVAAPDGALYASEGFDRPILRISRDGEVQEWSSAVTPNGLEVSADGKALLVAVTPQSRIDRIELADPESVSTVATLSGAESPSPKMPDDLGLRASTRRLYVAGHAGDVMRVDVRTGATCFLFSGQEPTAAAVARGFGQYTGAVFVTDFDGTIRVVRD